MDDTPLKACGEIRLQLRLGGKLKEETHITFHVVEGVNENILSVNRALDMGASVHFESDNCYIQWADGRKTTFARQGKQLTEPTGYIPATAQETLLHTFLGDRLAAQAALLADRWRQPMPAPVPSQPSHTPPQQADRQTPNATPLSIPTGPPPTMPHTAAETQQQPTPPDHPPSPSSSSSTASTNSTTSTSSTSSSSTMPRAPPAPHQQPQQFRQALESLDQVDLDTVLKQNFFWFPIPASFLERADPTSTSHST